MNTNTLAFAYACREDNSIEELELALDGYPDVIDCATWGITGQEWVDAINYALQMIADNQPDTRQVQIEFDRLQSFYRLYWLGYVQAEQRIRKSVLSEIERLVGRYSVDEIECKPVGEQYIRTP